MSTWNAVLMTFGQLLIGVTFAASLVGKIRDLPAFVHAVADFEVVPAGWSAGAARASLIVEIAVVALLAAGAVPGAVWAVTAGLVTAALLLTVYAVALTAVRVRGMRVSCHCFGTNAAKVSWYDVARNGLLIVGAVAGAVSVTGSGRPSVPDVVLIGMIAMAVALILINLADVVDTARKAGAID